MAQSVGRNGAGQEAQSSPNVSSRRAVAGLDLSDRDGSFEAFDAAIRADPGNPLAYVGRGQARQLKGEHEEALLDFEAAVRLAPEDHVALGNRAQARHRLGDLDGAIADLDRAIRLAPDVAWLFSGRGVALHNDGDPAAALADLTRAIELDPGFADGYARRGHVHHSEGDFAAAIADHDAAIRLGDADAGSYRRRGHARYMADDHEGAIADFSEAIRLEPSQPGAFLGRADARDAQGEYALADDDRDQAERLSDDEPTEEDDMSVTERKLQLHALIQSHFDPTPFDELAVTERQFPLRVRADLQRAVDQVFSGDVTISFFCGVRKAHAFEGISFSELLVRDRNNPAQSVPPVYEEIDIGEDQPIRCLKNGLWLVEADGAKFAVFLEQNTRFHTVQTLRIQVAAPNDKPGYRASQEFLGRLEESVRRAESYRGKILSLEGGERYTGESTGITVHKLDAVAREQVILPTKTLELLERNVIRFVGLRSRLKGLGLATKKGCFSTALRGRARRTRSITSPAR